jgi:hypothetical protein
MGAMSKLQLQFISPVQGILPLQNQMIVGVQPPKRVLLQQILLQEQQMVIQQQLLKQLVLRNPPGQQFAGQLPPRLQQLVLLQQILQQQRVQQMSPPQIQVLQIGPPQQAAGLVPALPPIAGQLPAPGQPFVQQQQPPPLADQLKAMIQKNPALLDLVQKNPQLIDLFAQYSGLLWNLQQEMLFQREIGQTFGQASLDDFLTRYKKQNPNFAGLDPAQQPSAMATALLQKLGQ